MGLRKRLSESRERSARERAKRREERRRADRAKADATPADRAKVREERRKAKRAAGVEKESKPKAAQKAPAKADEPTAKKPAEKKPAKAAKPAAKKPAKAAKDEPARKRSAKRPAARRPLAGKSVGPAAGKAATRIRAVVAEVLKLGREMIAIPVGLWMAAAEIAGKWVLWAWLHVLRPVLIALWRLARGALRFVERHVTPARAVALVALVAAGALAASQWLDYHSVSVGSDAYSGTVGAVAPPPEVESEIAGNAHGWVMLPLALGAIVALVVALTGHRRAALLLVPIGIVVLVIAVVVDVPKGLDEGDAAIAYEGASATLLKGFWMQIAAGVVLIACGLMLPRYLRPAPATARAPSGPTLFQQAGSAIRKRARKPKLQRPSRPRRPRPKRKVQGAGT